MTCFGLAISHYHLASATITAGKDPVSLLIPCLDLSNAVTRTTVHRVAYTGLLGPAITSAPGILAQRGQKQAQLMSSYHGADIRARESHGVL